MKFVRVMIVSLAALAFGGLQSVAGGESFVHGSSAPSPLAAPATDSSRIVQITCGDQMKFNVTSIEAKRGEALHIVLTNLGSLPKEAMGHNWVLLKAGVDPMEFAMAAAGARDTGYIPEDRKNDIVAKIGLLGPRQSGEATFLVPEQVGDYPFICSFPGHVAVGMKGILSVK